MTIDPKNPLHIIADEGNVFMRKYDQMVLGDEIILGYYKYDGVYRMETPDDFTEIVKPDDPEEDIQPEI